MVPYSNQTNKPQKESKNPRTQSNREAPTEPTEERIEEGVENIPVPMIRPTLTRQLSLAMKKGGKTYMSMVQLKTPKWRPIPPAASIMVFNISRIDKGPVCTFFKRKSTRVE